MSVARNQLLLAISEHIKSRHVSDAEALINECDVSDLVPMLRLVITTGKMVQVIPTDDDTMERIDLIETLLLGAIETVLGVDDGEAF